MGRIILIASGKGGVGKTTFTANLGIMLARHNKSVCLVDGDFGLNNLDVALGVENRVVYDVIDILQGNCRLSQGLVKDPVLSNLYMLASTKSEANKVVSKDVFKGLILDLERVFDFVLIDSPAGVDYGYERALSPAGEVVIITTPNITSIRDASKAIQKARKDECLDISVLINRMRWDLARKGELLTPKDIENLLGEKIIGVVPENNSLCAGYNIKTIFNSEPELVGVFSDIAQRIDRHEFISYCENKNNKLRTKKAKILFGRKC